MDFQDTICATSTAQGIGALGIVRVSGKEAIKIVNQIFKGKNIEEAESHTVHYGFIISSPTFLRGERTSNTQPQSSNMIDEVMVSVFKAPKTFTAEDLVEISCHGSPYIQQQIIEALIQQGARMAEPGEFTQRAFLNGRIDLSQAEAVADLIRPKTELRTGLRSTRCAAEFLRN